MIGVEEELEKETDPERRLAIEEEISALRVKANAINYLDKPDLRTITLFHNHILSHKL